MNDQREQFVLPTRKILIFSLLFGLAPFAGGCLPQGLRLPESPLLRALERKLGLIAYVGPDGNIHTMDQAGGNQAGVTDDARLFSGEEGRALRIYQYPAWAPGNRRLAYVGFSGSLQNND